MKEKKRLSRNQIWVIVLTALIVVTLITGSAVLYAKYTQTDSGGTGISVIVQTGTQTQLVEEAYQEGDYTFNEIPAVFPFG